MKPARPRAMPTSIFCAGAGAEAGAGHSSTSGAAEGSCLETATVAVVPAEATVASIAAAACNPEPAAFAV